MDNIEMLGKKYAGVLSVEAAASLHTGVNGKPGVFILYGVLDHDILRRFPDNTTIETSPLVGLTIRDGQLVALTQNTAYRLSGTHLFDVIDSNRDFRAMFNQLKEGLEAANRMAHQLKDK